MTSRQAMNTLDYNRDKIKEVEITEPGSLPTLNEANYKLFTDPKFNNNSNCRIETRHTLVFDTRSESGVPKYQIESLNWIVVYNEMSETLCSKCLSLDWTSDTGLMAEESIPDQNLFPT